MAMGNIAVEIDSAIVRRGFHVKKNLADSIRHRLDLVENDTGVQFVVKSAVTPTEILNLRNEVLANQFLSARVPGDARFAFPTSEIWEDDEVFVAATSVAKGRWLAKQNPYRLAKPLTNTDLEDMFQLMLFLHRIPKKDVPAFFLARAEQEFTLEQTLEKQANYLEPAIEQIISRDEALALQRVMREVGYRRRFIHHDTQIQNFVRLRDGRLMLTDAEFARWEMKWYDVAYFFCQTWLLSGDKATAQRGLRYFVQRFREELPRENIEHEIFFPLGYCVAMNVFIAMRNTKIPRKPIRQVLEAIITLDLDWLTGMR